MVVELLVLWKCINYMVNVHADCTTTDVAPPNTINPKHVVRHYRIVQGRNGGTSTVTSFIMPVFFVSYHGKIDSQELNYYFSINKQVT